jgi:pimeloyl-ACP methyl ester carboxylesterase
MPDVEVGDLRVAWTQSGHGPPLVLLHGGLSDHRDWQGQIDGLSDKFTVYAWDAPGCGRSSDPPQSWRMPEYADCVVAWLAAIGVHRPHFGGLSWGATLAIEVYRQRPELPASLILCGAYAGWAGSLSPEERDRRLQDFLADLALPPAELAARYVASMVSADAPRALLDQLVAVMSDVRVDGARPMLYAIAEADLRAVLPTIAVPTLLLYGELDERSSADVAAAMTRTIPTSELVVIPGAGHCCNLEEPALFNQQVRQFLQPLT